MARISVAREVQKPQDYASDGTDAIGFIHFWGNSPALDLVGQDPQAVAFGPAAVGTSPGGVYKPKEEEERADADAADAEAEVEAAVEDAEEEHWAGGGPPLPESAGEGPVNVLVVGAADLRHVLKTVARQKVDRPQRRIRFFLHEKHHEGLARHLLLLQVVNNSRLPVRERVETFLSLYGNTLVRERDSHYVSEIAKEFVELVTDSSTHPLASLIDLTHLKYKDRDVLQDIFKGWDQAVPFDVEALREQRCRGYYRERYDHRKNLMDLDYQSHIKDVAGIIHWQHYKEFCHSGVAFETRLASYNTPNRSLASYTEAKGTSVQVRGFWGDIINSPYHAFGTTSRAEHRSRLFKISGQMYRHHETDLSEYNVTAFLSEMENRQPFSLPPERPEEHEFPYASPLEAMRTEPRVEEVPESEVPPAQEEPAAPRRRGASKRKEAVEWPPLSSGFEGVEVVFLTGDLGDVLRKPKYARLFHRAFVGSMAVLPVLEELGLTQGGDDPFTPKEGVWHIRKPPRLEAPELFGQRADKSSLGSALAEGAVVVFETMKYQAHFDATTKLSFRHRLAQAGHLAGWRLLDERHALPRLEHDMKERRARQLEKDSADFLRFFVPPPTTEPPAA